MQIFVWIAAGYPAFMTEEKDCCMVLSVAFYFSCKFIGTVADYPVFYEHDIYFSKYGANLV